MRPRRSFSPYIFLIPEGLDFRDLLAILALPSKYDVNAFVVVLLLAINASEPGKLPGIGQPSSMFSVIRHFFLLPHSHR